MNSRIKCISTIFFICISCLGLGLLTFLIIRFSDRPAQITEPSLPVFYPHNIDKEDCETKIGLLEASKLRTVSGNLIGLAPDWTLDDYDLHSLRFLDCLIWEGEQGNHQSFDLVKNIILDWDLKNSFSDKIDSWTWKDDKGKWSEHGVAWRAVLLSYFYRMAQKLSPDDQDLTKTLQRMAKEHGNFLSSSKPYMADHNHGLNHAMGLLALGTAFQELPQAGKWIDLSLARAEQQMRDNVSNDGVHLEQSGFYHFYTLRTFMEIFNVSQSMDLPLSTEYRQKLDRMIEVGALMAGINRKVEGIPWNNYDLNVFDYIKNGFPLDLGMSSPGIELFEKMKQGYSKRDLFVKQEGGYSFFTGDFGTELEIIFHTRILSAPHAQPDALGLTATLGNQRILSYGNYTSSSREPKDFNTVLADDLKQNTTLNLKPKPPLRQRLIPRGGELLSSGSTPDLDFVTAKNQAYSGITHTRTAARIGGKYLLVWDYLEADTVREFTQTFHFAVPVQLVVNEGKGTANLRDKTIAHFVQLEGGVEASICDTHSQNDKLCSWESGNAGGMIPTPEINYRSNGRTVEFIWVLYAGDGTFDAQASKSDNRQFATRCVTLSGDGGNYQVHLQRNNQSVALQCPDKS